MGSQIVDTAPASIYPVAIVILSALFLAAMSMVAYFAKDLKASLEKGQKKQDDAIDRVAGDLSTLKASLPMTYVLRDDWIRGIATLDRKLDLVARDVASVARATGASRQDTGEVGAE